MENRQYQAMTELIMLSEHSKQLYDKLDLDPDELYALHSIERKSIFKEWLENQINDITIITNSDIAMKFHLMCKSEILIGVSYHKTSNEIVKSILEEVNELELKYTKLYTDHIELLTGDAIFTMSCSFEDSIQFLCTLLLNPYKFSEKVRQQILMMILDKIATPEANVACRSLLLGK